jgi:hypothetical protein
LSVPGEGTEQRPYAPRAQCTCNFVSVNAGQSDIQNHDFGVQPLGLGKSVFAVVGDRNTVPVSGSVCESACTATIMVGAIAAMRQAVALKISALRIVLKVGSNPKRLRR